MSSSGSRASLSNDFERFKRALPRDFPEYVRDAYRINLSAQFLGQPLPHPIGKGSGQLSLNAGQLETDAEAGLAFVVLKTVIAQDAAGELSSVQLTDGSRLTADAFVFACGPWLGALFPDVIGERVRPTRQEVFFFGTPAGDRRFTEEALPVWADHGTRFMYGIPGNEWRGFKVADDTRGPLFDPTTGERKPSDAALQIAREYLAYRFPGLAGAPLVESRVCQYEESPDEHFIIDRHPAAGNIWLVGGGSGHGFKHGPAVGELVARLVLTGEAPDEQFKLSRFAR